MYCWPWVCLWVLYMEVWQKTRRTNRQTICSRRTLSQHIKHLQRKHDEQKLQQIWGVFGRRIRRIAWSSLFCWIPSWARPMGDCKSACWHLWDLQLITFPVQLGQWQFLGIKTWQKQKLISAIVVAQPLLMDRAKFEKFQQKTNKLCFLLHCQWHDRYLRVALKDVLPKSYYWQRQWSATGKMRTIAVALSEAAQSSEGHDNTRSGSSDF